jgi:tetratricopeptide (TPR) repeat protein
MKELHLRAERTLAMGLLDQAEALYHAALAEDPDDAVAVMGLARVAVERAEDAEAFRLAARASALDPGNEAAAALVLRLHEILSARGDQVVLPPHLRRRRKAVG